MVGNSEHALLQPAADLTDREGICRTALPGLIDLHLSVAAAQELEIRSLVGSPSALKTTARACSRDISLIIEISYQPP